MPNLDIDYTQTVLKNKGVPVRLKVLNDDGSEQFDSEGELKTEIHFVRLNAGHMMELEDQLHGYTVKVSEPEVRMKNFTETDKVTGEINLVSRPATTGNVILVNKSFYGMDALEEMGRREPFKAVVTAMSIALGLPQKEVATRLITQEMEMYFVSITGAIQIANGIDPFQIQRLLESSAAAVGAARRANDAGIEVLTKQNEEVVTEVTKTLNRADGLLGKTGSLSGPEDSETATKSSSS